MGNRQAVTNRENVVGDLLVKAFSKFANEPNVIILSMVAGTAQTMLEAVLKCPNINIKVIVVDINFNRSTLAEASRLMRLVHEKGLSGRFVIISGKPRMAINICNIWLIIL